MPAQDPGPFLLVKKTLTLFGKPPTLLSFPDSVVVASHSPNSHTAASSLNEVM